MLLAAGSPPASFRLRLGADTFALSYGHYYLHHRGLSPLSPFSAVGAYRIDRHRTEEMEGDHP